MNKRQPPQLKIDELRELATEGKTRKEASFLLKMRYGTVLKWSKNYEIQFQEGRPKEPKSRPKELLTPKEKTNSWPEDRKIKLKHLWESGEKTKEIAKILKVTKSAVIGMARRIGCTHRPSPIIRNGASVRPYSNRRKSSLPRLESSASMGETVMESLTEEKSTSVEVCEPIVMSPEVAILPPEPPQILEVAVPASEDVLDLDMSARLREHENTIRRLVESLPVVEPRVLQAAPSNTCQWTDSDRKPWVFCGKPAIFGTAWCAKCRRRVYQPSGRQQFKAA